MIVGIADLGIGNFAAMAKMITQLGGLPRRMTSPDELPSASHIILPGVGSFDFAATVIDQRGWRGPLLKLLSEGNRPLLGACVGMQLLVDSSHEGHGTGLGWIPGECVRIEPPSGSGLKVPHMGWNQVTPAGPSLLFPAGPEAVVDERFYFVHSYRVDCVDPNDVWATTDHGGPITAAIGRDQVMGVQFHPEKSHRFGLELLRRFLAIQC